MSAWSDRNSGSSPVAGTGSGRNFNDAGVGIPSSAGAGVYRPTPSGNAGGADPFSNEELPGVVSINPLDLPGTIQKSGGPIGDLFDGLRQALVGGNEGRDDAGFEDKSLFGGTPILGNIGRTIANTVGLGGDVAGNTLGAVGGALERVNLPNGLPSQVLDSEYAAIPAEFRKKYDESIAAEHGLFGTGLFDNDDHFKSAAIRAYREDQQYEKPTLAPGAFTPPGSLADTVTNLFDVLGVSAIVVAKGWAQLDTPGQAGLDRIDLIMAVGDGQATFNPDKGLLGTGILSGDPTTGLNAAEKLVYTKMKSGDWTRDQAADFLASNAQAFGHSAIANIGGMVALDPLNIATFGAGAIAKTGTRGLLQLQRVEAAQAKLAQIGRAADEAFDALQAAKRAGGSTKAEQLAFDAAQVDLKAAQDSVTAFHAYQSGGSIRAANVLARAAEGSTKVSSGLQYAGRMYGALEGTALGRAAKVARTVIDPMHAIDFHMPGASRAVDIYSDSMPRSIAQTLGDHHYKAILDEVLRLDHTGAMFDQLTRDFGVASANLAREGVVQMYRAAQVAGNLGEELMKKLPEDIFDVAVQSTKQRDLEKWLRHTALKHVQVDHWDDVSHRILANGLAHAYPSPRDAEGWLRVIRGMSKEQKSLYKFAVYGNVNRRLLDFVANASPDLSANLSMPVGRLVLLARGTLTRLGGESLLTKLSAPGLKRNAKLKLIAEWQERYPQLRYLTIDPANLERSIDNFVEWLEEGLDRLPMQLTDDELQQLGSEGDDLRALLGEYSLGFRPEERFLWGLERENGTGLYRVATDAWVDHVADGAMAYRPAQALRMNIAGHPLVDVPVARAAIRAIDHIDSAARLMKTQVTSAMVGEAARKRFVARAVSGDLAEHGVTEKVASDWFERITQYTREHQGYSGPRGMGGSELYKALKEKNLIPQPLLNGERKLNPHDVMRLVLEAYDGDLRYIGLTQKLSGRAKRYLFETTGSNWAGQIAEHAWPTLKFRYNPIFQLQEKVEPWVLNAQRGVSFATGVKMSSADLATEALLQKFTDLSLVRQADLDQFEYSSEVLFGGIVRKTANRPGTALNRLQSVAQALTEVQGMKRVNMLRTFRKGLGKELRSAWDESRPGEYDQMKEFADLKAGRVLDEDEFALSVVTQNAYANDVPVAGGKADWANAIKTGEWHAPTTLGELKKLDLEHVAASLRLTNNAGEDIKDLTALRQAIAVEPGTMDRVVDGLTRLGADPDYIRRVKHSLSFSWGGFWKTAEKRFSLTPDESNALQAMMAESARLRDMTPVEFMSQVFSPMLIDGTEGILGYLEGPARILREARAAGRKVKARDAKLAETRTQLAGKEGISTRDDLIKQLSRAFSSHLDPSARRALLMEFKPELRDAVNSGALRLDLQDLQNMWDELAEDELANRILGYMDGVPGSNPFDPVTDAARGVEAARQAATSYMLKRGVTPRGERRYYQNDEPFYEETARAYSALPDTPYDRTGRKPTIKSVHAASTDLKPRPPEVDERTYSAYLDFVTETRAQWDHITGAKSKGGMGIKVIASKKAAPYADSAAMRADVAKGELRVFVGDSDHPLMTNEQLIQFRAVHDVFGHAAEGFEFGPRGELNAAAHHAGMYSDTGRPAMLTETHGQTAWNNYSDDIIEDEGAAPFVLDKDDPAADYERQFPFESPDYDPDDPDSANTLAMDLYGDDAYGVRTDFPYEVDRRIGDGIAYDIPNDGPGGSHELLTLAGSLQRQFPDHQMYHLDAPLDLHEPVEVGILGYGVDPNTNGLTWGANHNEAIVHMSPDLLGQQYESSMKAGAAADLRTRGQTHFTYMKRGDKKMGSHPRQSYPGVPWNASYGPSHVLTHEFGHVVDSALRPLGHAAGMPTFGMRAEHHAYGLFVNDYLQSEARKWVSEYGFMDDRDAMADLFSLAFDPNIDFAGLHPEVQQAITDLKQALKDSGAWQEPKGAPNPFVGQRVRDVNGNPRAGSAPALPAPTKGMTRIYTTDVPGMFTETPGAASGSALIPEDAVLDLTSFVGSRVARDEVARLYDLSVKNMGSDPARAALYANRAEDFERLLDAFYVDYNETVAEVLQRAVDEPDTFDMLLGGASGKKAIRTDDGLVIRDQSIVQPEHDNIYQTGKPGSVYAKQKAVLLPQELLDRFGTQFVGKGKHVESNPDVARAAQMFGKWTDAVVTNGLLRGDQSVHGQLLNDIAGLPTGAAVPYNYTEGAVANLATNAMVRKWDDAFRLQYFAQERTFLERSMNHPMFGLYPASYMWGKIMPEVVRFIAQEPFGQKTGGVLYSAMDAQAAIAIRREYDPYFDAKLEELGHSQALSFAGYMMPSLPWDISASAPGWMRAISEQGTAQREAREAGLEQEDVSLLKPATDTFKKLVPLTTTLPWAGRAIDEVNGADEQEANNATLAEDKLVQASELGPTLQRVMQELQEALQ